MELVLRGRLHELIKCHFSAPISDPYEVSRSVLVLKTGPFEAHVDAPLWSRCGCWMNISWWPSKCFSFYLLPILTKLCVYCSLAMRLKIKKKNMYTFYHPTLFSEIFRSTSGAFSDQKMNNPSKVILPSFLNIWLLDSSSSKDKLHGTFNRASWVIISLHPCLWILNTSLKVLNFYASIFPSATFMFKISPSSSFFFMHHGSWDLHGNWFHHGDQLTNYSDGSSHQAIHPSIHPSTIRLLTNLLDLEVFSSSSFFLLAFIAALQDETACLPCCCRSSY